MWRWLLRHIPTVCIVCLQDPYTTVTAASQRQLPPPQTQSFQDRLAPQRAMQQLALRPVRGQQPVVQQQAYAPDVPQARDPRSRRRAAVPASTPSAREVHVLQVMPTAWTARTFALPTCVQQVVMF